MRICKTEISRKSCSGSKINLRWRVRGVEVRVEVEEGVEVGEVKEEVKVEIGVVKEE